MKMKYTSMISLAALCLTAPAQAQLLPSTGAETSAVQACFYECKPGPLIQDQRTYRELTTLMVTNNGRFPTLAEVYFLDGNENVVARTDLALSELDVDELQVCATIERITGAQPPEAGLIQITDPLSVAQQEPSGVFAFIKNIGGKFFADNPEPFDGRVVGIGKTQCKYIAVPEVNDPDFIASLGANAPAGPAVLVENTGDGPAEDLPDLLPLPVPGIPPTDPAAYCRLAGGVDQLEVVISNQGLGGAGPSTTTVDFGAYGSQTLSTSSLGSGGSDNVIFSIPVIPSNCYDPDCDFTIRVDSGSSITESNEGNNVAAGLCQG